MMYQVRRAAMEDLETIEMIYAHARAFMAQNGNPNQWGKTHPQTNQLLSDLRQGNLYLVFDEGGIHGVFAFILGDDPTYAYIEQGTWHSSEPYGTIHRVASDGSGGIFSAVLAYCKGEISHLRIDTHGDNLPMQHVVEKHGFHRCGIIYVADGSPRIAYDIL